MRPQYLNETNTSFHIGFPKRSLNNEFGTKILIERKKNSIKGLKKNEVSDKWAIMTSLRETMFYFTQHTELIEHSYFI